MIQRPAMKTHPPLPRSYKGVFPFRLSVPSFIYPDHWVPNVRMLGPHVDEIELLLFESRSESLIPESDIRTLAALGRDLSLTYNIHLPTDVSLTHPDPARRKSAVDALTRTISLTEPLNPSAWVLHLPGDGLSDDPADIVKWRDRAADGLRRLLACGIPTEKLAVETLEYPPPQLFPLLDTFGLPICLDVGHLILAGHDPVRFLDTHRERLPLIHLHGVSAGKDHQSLKQLPEPCAAGMSKQLKRFKGIVSVEVFSYKNLVDSLDWLTENGLDAGGAA